jgi:hypothetical protein
MKPKDSNHRWQLVEDTDTYYTTIFQDANGKQIKVDDVIEYTRKKNTGRSRNLIPAGTVIRARVIGIVVRVRKKYKTIEVIRAITVSPRGCNGILNISGTAYRIYDTSKVTIVNPVTEG